MLGLEQLLAVSMTLTMLLLRHTVPSQFGQCPSRALGGGRRRCWPVKEELTDGDRYKSTRIPTTYHLCVVSWIGRYCVHRSLHPPSS